MAGYSGTPLVKKLGIKPGMRVRFINPPEEFPESLGDLPDVTIVKRAQKNLDYVHLFAADCATLRKSLPGARDSIRRDGMVWISWPKKSSGVVSDLTESIVRKAGLDAGLVDVKVCAVDETWSGLKFVYRLADR